MFHTVFDHHDIDRIAAWKKFRDGLEDSSNPLEQVAQLWGRAPFVNSYLDPKNPQSWPDPWRLILDLRLDDLAISLGIVYTLKLTRRFMETPIEIHMSMLPEEKNYRFPVIVNNESVLNWHYNSVSNISCLREVQTTLIYSKSGAL